MSNQNFTSSVNIGMLDACKTDLFIRKDDHETVIAIDKNATVFSPAGEVETQAHFPVIEKIKNWLKDDVARKQ